MHSVPLRMRPFAAAFLLLLASACATVPFSSGDDRGRLWRQGHEAFYAKDFPAATAAFQRLASEHPRAGEGREARYYLGMLTLDPANPAFDVRAASEHLGIYLSLDSVAPGVLRHRPEAGSLLAFAQELQRVCPDPAGKLRCGGTPPTVIVERPPAGAPPTPAPTAEAAEIARLRRELNQRDETIRQLREELQRIRNTLSPPPARP